MADKRTHNPTPHQPPAWQAAIGHGRSGARHLVSILATAAVFVIVLIACSGPGNQNEPPAAPGSVTANPIPGGVRVVWLDQSSNEAEFIVFRSTEGGDEDAATLTEIARVPTDAVMYEDFAVETSGSYQYAVAATNQFGTSEQVLQEPADAVSPGIGVRLTLTFAGVGSVDVLNGGQTVVCTSHCVLGIAQGSSVTLTAAGVEGSAFAGWDGACSMAGPCTFTINDDTDVEARFSRHVLLLSATGDSPVDLVVSPADAFGATECTLAPGQACAFGYEFDAALKVSVNSTLVEAQATFGGYGGACTSPVGRYCLIDVDGETTVAVEVVRVPVVGAKAYAGLEDSPLTVTAVDGLLAGVVDTPGDSHVAFVASGPTSGSLTVADDGSFVFQPAQDANGEVTFQFAARDAHGNESAAKTVTLTVGAVNDAPTFALAADPPATVGNAVQVSRPNFATDLHPGGGADETGQALTFTIVRTAGVADLLSIAPSLTVSGTSATLTYTPALGKFGTATYEARLKDNGGTANGGSDTSAPLTFTLTVSPVTLTAAITGGSGGGSIGRNPTGTPNGPNRFDYGYGTDVTLTASPAGGSQFVSWGGACAGIGAQSCVVDMTADTSVSAEFIAIHTLTVGFESVGSGPFIRVDSAPGGVDNCNNYFTAGSDLCNAVYTHGQAVTLTASGTSPVLWSAPCPAGASGSCQLTINEPTVITVSVP